MKKKVIYIITAVLSLACVIAVTVVLATCDFSGGTPDDNPPAHTHNYKQQHDETEHWLHCDVLDCTEKIKDRAAHNTNGNNGSCSVCGYKAGGTDNPPHSHAWSQEWESNDTHHWHNCTAENCTITDNSEKEGYAEHNFTDGDCVCGKPAPHSHAWSQEWESNDTHHWHNCTAENCTITDNSEKEGYAEHNFTDGDCVCGKPAPHSHAWSQEWESNDTHHWHNCTAENCTITDNSEKEGYAEHNFTDGDCVCGKKDPSIPTEGLEYTLNDDGESYSVKGIGTATDTDIVIASEYNGKSVTSIQSYAFSRCSGLTSITIPDSVTSIEQGAFENCSGLTSITIPDNVTSIGNFAFWGCSGLTSITIPDSITSIGDRAFYNCSSLQYNEFDNAYYFGNSTNPYLALITAKDTAITSCTIHKNTKFIVGPVFAKCSSLTSITIPDGVTSISNYMFQDCSGLTSIVIPDSITSIGQSAFYNCKGLTSITFNGTKAQWNDIEKDYFWNSGTGNYTVHCTDGDIAKDN